MKRIAVGMVMAASVALTPVALASGAAAIGTITAGVPKAPANHGEAPGKICKKTGAVVQTLKFGQLTCKSTGKGFARWVRG